MSTKRKGLLDLPLNKVPEELHEYWITINEAVPVWGWFLIIGFIVAGFIL
jgi:hypothetical protein